MPFLRILFSSLEKENFQRFALNELPVFLAIISLIMQEMPPFEQTLTTHVQGLFVSK